MLCLIAGSVIILVVKERKPGTVSKNRHTGTEVPLVLYFLLLVAYIFFRIKVVWAG